MKYAAVLCVPAVSPSHLMLNTHHNTPNRCQNFFLRNPSFKFTCGLFLLLTCPTILYSSHTYNILSRKSLNFLDQGQVIPYLPPVGATTWYVNSLLLSHRSFNRETLCTIPHYQLSAHKFTLNSEQFEGLAKTSLHQQS